MNIKVGDRVLATIGNHWGDTVYKWYPATVTNVCRYDFTLRFPDGNYWGYSLLKQRDDGNLWAFPLEWIRPMFLKNSLEVTE